MDEETNWKIVRRLHLLLQVKLQHVNCQIYDVFSRAIKTELHVVVHNTTSKVISSWEQGSQCPSILRAAIESDLQDLLQNICKYLFCLLGTYHFKFICLSSCQDWKQSFLLPALLRYSIRCKK